MLDIDAVRRETPGCRTRIHLNNAGASLMPQPVLDTVVEHLRLEADIGGYEAAVAAEDRLAAVYDSAARLLGCARTEVALFENATRAFNAVLYALRFGPGDRILTGQAEYSSNYMAYLHLAKVHGVEVVVIRDDACGQIDVDELGRRIDERARLIALTHVPTSGGLVNPARAVGQIARDAGVPFLLDACQSVGQMPIDVAEIGCDFLSTAGRKFLRGPRGTGLLYVNRRCIDSLHPATIDLGGANWTRPDSYELRPDARRFETWEAAHALRLGLGRAVDYALDVGLPAIWARVSELADRLRRQLNAIPAVTQHDLGETLCGIVTFSLANLDADATKQALAKGRVTVELSYMEDTRLDLEPRGLRRFVRASVHYFNTEDEIDQTCDLVESLAARGPQLA